MKKILLLGLVALFFFTIEAQEVKAGVVFEQTQANGYWLSDGGYAFFCGSGTECEKITQYNISPGILTNFNGSRAFTSTGENVIKTVSLSLAKQPAMADPGRLIMWCDGFESNYFFYSTQSLKASDLEVDSFKNFQFDFPHSPCKMPRGFLFEMAGGFSDMKVEAVKADNKPFYGIGHIQWAGGPDGFGSPTGYESYEPYIQVSEGSYEPYTPPCDTGYKTSGYDEAPLPTYDYDQTDGLVKFHFKTNGSQFTYRRFNNVCELQYPVLWSQKGDLFNYTPATNNIMIQAKEVKDESGNFLYYSWKAFNEDNGQELPISLDDSRLAFTDPVMSIGFFSYIGYPNSTPYFEYSYFSPAVWVKDPNFVPNPTPTKTPVLIIPGTLGTEIWKGDNRLWMDIDKMKNPVDSDSFMDPMSFKADGTPLDTSLKLGSVLTLPHSSFNYSQKLIDDLSDNGYDLNKSVFLFPYDWRDDIQKNSNIFLKEKIDEIIASSSASKIDVIAHSQGGLLIKRLLFNHPEYVSKINNLVFVGTPNLGSPKSVKILVYGDDLGVRRFGVELLNSGEIKKISQNMPAIYQMLPSREYFNHSSGYLGQYIYNLDSKYGQISSSFDETKNIIKKATYNLNSDQIDKADSFHSAEFDNLDLTGSGIKAYNIMGCESPTIDRVYINGSDGKDDVQYGPGDGTVPIISASNIGGTQNFYVLNKESIHGAMLTTEGVREKIVSLIAGTTYNSNSIVTTNPALCVFKGKKVEVHSPVDLHIYDENGNHVGINSQGGFDYEMPEVQYDEIGHSKYAFLPDDEHSYSLRLVATDDGVFNFYSSSVEGSETKSISYYSDITISSSSVAQIVLNSQNNQAINFLTDNRVFFPSSILNLEQSKDSVFPISTSTIIGLFGEPGFYRSNATITLSALDPIIDGKTEEASGVLKTQYSLDGGEYLTYSTTSPIVITSEGEHSVKFYSTDRAGNNEPEQEINFVIDKTPPELIIAFNPFIKDLEFIATDTLPSIVTTTSTQPKFKWPKIPAIKFKDSDNIIAATDAAGNTIQLELKDKNRKSLMSAEIKSIKYNGQAANISKNKLAFVWQYNKNGNLSYLLQNAQSKVGFNILAVYNGSKTTLAGKDGKGFINKTLIGLNVLTLSTIKGDLNWSIKSVSLPPPIVRRR